MTTKVKSRTRSRRQVLAAATSLVLAVALVFGLSQGVGPVPALGTLLDPADGLYRTARHATSAMTSGTLQISSLDAPVSVVRDARGVPHIFAENDRDAVTALGYVTAQDRLFQMDFIARVASGRLAEAFGPSSVAADQFLRQTGMDWGARKNLVQVREAQGIEWDLMRWYTSGVNAYLDELAPEDLPLEFRLLGYTPDRFSPLQVLRVLQYMAYDLTYRSDAATYATLRERLGPDAYELLYPRDPWLSVPIVPPGAATTAGRASSASTRSGVAASARRVLAAREAQQEALRGTLAEGYRPGKGSNNWAVAGARSTTGRPILAGDMHLSLSLPSVWYEAHLVTPTMNSYGVTVPGAPMLVEAFNEHVGWTFTNTGADQIDHLALDVDSSRQRYRFDGAWRALEAVPDTIRVNGASPIIDTLYYSHHGPVVFGNPANEGGAVAMRWVAHERSRTLRALWGMNYAQNLEDFESALRYWDTPMQNVLYAGTDGHIAIRSAGLLPIRRAGHGEGLLDGTTDRFAWVGRVPFDSLPYARDPAQGFLTSSNQKPTANGYPYYLGHDWRDVYRSIRLDTLLRSKPEHSVEDMKRYQSDVHAVQRDLFVPLLVSLDALSPRADTLRTMLSAWDGATTVDRPEPLVLDTFMKTLQRLAWDEHTFNGVPRPQDAQLLRLLRTHPSATWLDVQDTPAVESASELLAGALEATADTLTARYGWGVEHWRWGDHHTIIFPHLTQAEPLRALWRGPYVYPGFQATVSPAGSLQTTKSASWRMVVDFSQTPPVGFGVYPGGQSGQPFHPALYDAHLRTYLDFAYYRLLKPAAPNELSDDQVAARVELLPDE